MKKISEKILFKNIGKIAKGVAQNFE
jgi:hypothetical protein